MCECHKNSELASFILAVLTKVGRVWEVVDEHEEEMLEQKTRDEDNGIETNLEMYLKHIYKEYVDYFAKMRRLEMEWNRRGKDVDVMPGRAATCANGLANLTKSDTKIKACVEKRVMKEKIMEL